MKIERVIISGGGTGGHIFPAVAIANEIKHKYPDVKILFVGAEGKMEMEKIPKEGYEIIGLPIRGLQRKLTLANLSFPFKLWASLRKAKKIIKTFQPQIAIGVGGYASAATLRVAAKKSVPTLIQEQNSYPGITNKWLAPKAKKICVAYPGMEKYFPAEKIVLTGNPIRKNVVEIEGKRKEGFEKFGLNEDKKTILVIGGSLGAGTINQSFKNKIDLLLEHDIQVIWQCGKFYISDLKKFTDEMNNKNIYLSDFIYEMDLAYACADIIVSRAGAISISELCLIKKPTILVPSPNVAEDHQTKNAKALTDINAAVLIKDSNADNELIPTLLDIINDENQKAELAKNIAQLGIDNAAERIVNEIENILKE